MKKLLLIETIVLMIFAGCVLSGCGKDQTPEPNTVTYTLSSDKVEAAVGEPITFTVKSDDGRDVTAQWVFCDENNSYSGNVVSYSEAGRYVVSAHAGNDESIVARNTVSVTITEAEMPDDEVYYTLSSDKKNVVVDEVITFTVTSSSGEDVTSQWSVCDESFCYVTNAFSYSSAGTHTISAHCTSNPELEARNTVTITVSSKGSGNPSVNPDAEYKLCVESEDVYVYDQIDFTVREFIDGEDNGPSDLSFQLVVDEVKTLGLMSYIFNKPGVYEVRAAVFNFRGQELASTDAIRITASEREIIGYSDDYYRRSLFLKRSTTDCTTCPAMERALVIAMETYVPNRLVPVALHINDDACGVSAWTPFEIMESDYYFYNVPNYVIDWNSNYRSGSQYSEEEIAEKTKKWQKHVSSDQTPGLAMETALDGQHLSLTLKTVPRVTDEYLLGVYLLESGFETYQSGTTGNIGEQSNVLYYSLTDGTDHNKLQDLGQLESGQEYVYNFEFTIPESTGASNNHYHNLDNFTVVYFICRRNSSYMPHGYYCANAISVAMGESVDYEYEPVYAE